MRNLIFRCLAIILLIPNVAFSLFQAYYLLEDVSFIVQFWDILRVSAVGVIVGFIANAIMIVFNAFLVYRVVWKKELAGSIIAVPTLLVSFITWFVVVLFVPTPTDEFAERCESTIGKPLVIETIDSLKGWCVAYNTEEGEAIQVRRCTSQDIQDYQDFLKSCPAENTEQAWECVRKAEGRGKLQMNEDKAFMILEEETYFSQMRCMLKPTSNGVEAWLDYKFD